MIPHKGKSKTPMWLHYGINFVSFKGSVSPNYKSIYFSLALLISRQADPFKSEISEVSEISVSEISAASQIHLMWKAFCLWCSKHWEMRFEKLNSSCFFCLSLDNPQTSLSTVFTGTLFYKRNVNRKVCRIFKLTWTVLLERHSAVEFFKSNCFNLIDLSCTNFHFNPLYCGGGSLETDILKPKPW